MPLLESVFKKGQAMTGSAKSGQSNKWLCCGDVREEPGDVRVYRLHGELVDLFAE
jgi:hypothetical protein